MLTNTPLRFAVAAALAMIQYSLSSGAQTAALPNVSYQASEVIQLWPGHAPGETGGLGPEHVLPDRPRPFDQITDVSVPTLSVFLPPEAKRTGTAMLVIPGGGLDRLAIEHEGIEAAEWLNDRGIAAFVLKYRVPPRDPEQRWKVGLQDAQRAMSIIRSRTGEWMIDENAIGCIGFSAGGEINVMLSTYYNERQYEPVDAADTLSTRPDFNIPIYSGGIADGRNNVLREDIASRINEQTPPMFIVHAFDDWAQSSIILMGALKRANVVSELHLFGAGAHGFGFRESGLPVDDWRELMMKWLGWQGFLDSPSVRSYSRAYVEARVSNSGSLPRFSEFDPAASLDQAFAVQRRSVRAVTGADIKVAGYKGAFTSVAAQEAFGITQPVHGVLYEPGRVDGTKHATITVDPERPILVETEIGYIMAVDIGTKVLAPRQAMTAAESIVPVIELPANVGALMTGAPNVLDMTAANVGSNLFIVGSPVDPKAIANPDLLKVSLSRDGTVLHQSSGADAKEGQAQNLMNLINQIVEQGRVIHKGDIIVSGSLGGARPGENGNYTADFGELGRIEFTIE